MSGSHFVKSWGAEPVGDGRWLFRLWAPAAAGIGLQLADRAHRLDRAEDGWFEGEFPASPGDSYVFVLDGGQSVPDPAARAQAGDVHGPSLLVDPAAYRWQSEWAGRPWEETVLYELHVGAFSDNGDFDGVRARLDHLAATGVTAIELCPVAQFSGDRGWGYDGVLLYAPHRAYGGRDGLKHLVDAAHARGLMVFLDVVYNHFGPDGNYLGLYAPEFFDPKRHTPWGPAIAYERQPVRRFFIDNALYWLEEYRLDGLRLDAIDQIRDTSRPPVIEEIAQAVRRHGFDRPVHLTTEDERNITALHRRDGQNRPLLYSGEWNDDFHHVAHVLATGEGDGYYADYADDTRGDMVIALREGFVEQGRPSGYRDGTPRGEPSAHLPPVAFVNFLQNHDQIGNRAFGERLTTLAEPRAVQVLTALLLLSPMIPLLFMGEEWGETGPFLFFTDFHGELADAVRTGRRREFAKWPQFADENMRRTIPDPNDPATFAGSRLDWSQADTAPGRERHRLVTRLLAIRAAEIVPRLKAMTAVNGEAAARGERGVEARWTLGDGSRLGCAANLGGAPFASGQWGSPLFTLGHPDQDRWSIRVVLEPSAS